MADQIITCSAECTVHIVHEVPLLDLDVDQGAAIGTAILLVWAIAWGFRQVYRFLISPDYHSSKED